VAIGGLEKEHRIAFSVQRIVQLAGVLDIEVVDPLHHENLERQAFSPGVSGQHRRPGAKVGRVDGELPGLSVVSVGGQGGVEDHFYHLL